MLRQALIAGGGIGGLAAALAVSRAGWDVRLYERASVFSEVGAGIQLGPNVVKVLHGWGLADALAGVAAFPERLEVRSALTGETLGVLRLGDVMAQRYGAPYATVHRADLHGLLLDAVQQAGVTLKLNRTLNRFTQNLEAVTVQSGDDPPVEGEVLVGADGLWSPVRQWLLGDGPPRATGHVAYRALLPQADLPDTLRSGQVTAWLGPKLHVVQYPVCGGRSLNVVGIVEGRTGGDLDNWDQGTDGAGLHAALAGSCAPLQDLVRAIPAWRLWALCDRPPMQGAYQHALGRVALLGDAAHPMRPYLAQGAGMAIEDAAELGRMLAQALDPAFDVPTLLGRYALNRWQRNARVQARAIRNGQIFHADGVVRLGRDASMKLLGERLLDVPWLYGGP
ncbi:MULTISPECIES: FAD-dependent monooxygenase [unclassified Polaromonas]|jgi:salicylate hydroxylase|uniref:FAD-dependent monooxygenase n=1 Tax=unclassified Polaromonas TaxID=2638319 RepID=UPI000BD614B6|nr:MULTISPECIES: FAD-dependent monooxygenase [unclassified Polaromonas]OYY36589.1 MAG: FAD-dependent oxidoreductase [Polaromonas sp. 35-63-35]OYZ22826.1 MAG: FAD-dependent oxidoreductase [Polaromonas sp. 16-63-31]OZA52820.1 MAG: FAD-dependent oxidoreductase [Polaromonas sp. 17-63-33]OZA88327.1 MAG: FAD-dependent oxidoreductase [Polaromonas sp. 39-63-25]HQS01271.1 FAD-dependent monooxygenase [Polaromonas sp.]